MYISMRESAAVGFKKWSAAHPQQRTTEGAAEIPARDDASAMEPVEPPRGPWLVPGPGTL